MEFCTESDHHMKIITIYINTYNKHIIKLSEEG